MKKILVLIIAMMFMFTGCKSVETEKETKNNSEVTEQKEETADEVVDDEKLYDVSGFYSGSINIPGSELPFTMEIKYKETITGHVDIEVQGAYDLALSNPIIEGNNVTLTIELGNGNAVLSGVFVDGIYEGDFTQNGQTFPFKLELGEKEEEEKLVISDEDLYDVSGFYSGAINIQGSDLPFTMEIKYKETITGHIDIEAQAAYNLPLSNTVIEGNKVTMIVDLGAGNAELSGVFVDGVYEGKFTQEGASFPFILKLAEKLVNANAEAFETTIGDIKIVGEYIIPKSDAKVPVALIIAGSGPTDMNCNSSGGVYTNAFLYLAEGLEKEGIASLRYNKRILNNPVVESELSFDDFVNDAEALVNILKEDERFSEVYIIGHSQGALIAKIIASRTEVDKIVSLAGTGRTIDQTLLDQLKPQLTEEQFTKTKDILKKIGNGETVKDVPEDLLAILREDIQGFMASWMKYDPTELIKDLGSDVLIIQGGVDIQVTEIEGEALRAANLEAEYAFIESMNHVLKETVADRSENLKTYQNIDLPIHSELVEVIVNFFNK